MKKKIKWILISIILLIMLITMIYLGNINWRNPDMTSKRLYITYWKEYLVGVIITISGYFGIQILLKD